MAKVRDARGIIVRRAKATAQSVRRGGEAVAGQLAAKATELAGRRDVKQTVKRAKKTLARVRTGASAMASKAAAKLTGRPKPSRARKSAKVALAIAGAAAVAAAGVGLARKGSR